MAKRTINSELFADAQKYLLGGVNSPVRAFNYAGCAPLIIKKGRGSKVYDYDGNKYIDYVLSWGSLILGHANPRVIKDIKKVIENGLGFGTTNEHEIELAEMILKAIPSIEKVRFVNSGTEAVMGAVRLARGYTKRDKILKFERSYHGHADYLLVKAGSGLATLGLPASAGVPRDSIKDTLIAGYGDKKAVENSFKKYGEKIKDNAITVQFGYKWLDDAAYFENINLSELKTKKINIHLAEERNFKLSLTKLVI